MPKAETSPYGPYPYNLCPCLPTPCRVWTELCPGSLGPCISRSILQCKRCKVEIDNCVVVGVGLQVFERLLWSWHSKYKQYLSPNGGGGRAGSREQTKRMRENRD